MTEIGPREPAALARVQSPGILMIRFNPLGPIFEKELRATSRRRRTYILRVAYLGAMLLFLLVAYLATRPSGASVSVSQRVQQQSELGQAFFAVFSMFGVIAMGVIGPVMTSTAIGAERLHKTLPVLLMTPITSLQVVTGKLFSRLLVSLTLIGLSLPVLALVRLLGGVELSQMLAVLALCAVTAVSTAAVGLFFSTMINRAWAVILLSYMSMFALFFFVPFAASAIMRTGGWLWLKLFAAVNPAVNVAMLAIPDAGMRGGHDWWIGAAVHGTLAVLLTAASAILVRRIQRNEGSATAAMAPVRDEPAGNPRRIDRRDVGDNPVLWRELGQRLFPSRWQSRAAAFVLVGMLLASYGIFAANNALEDEEAHILYAIVFNGLTWLAVCVLAATAIAQEIESDTWTLLLATPLKARAIVLGKAVGICRRMLWPMALVAAHFSLFAALGLCSWVAAFWAMWIIITFNTIWVATGIYLSLRLARVTLSVVLNLLIGAAMYAALPLLLLILGEAIAGTDNWVEGAGVWIPYVYLASGLDAFIPEYHASKRVWLPSDGYSTSSMLLALGVIAGVVHLLVSTALLIWTIRRFDNIVGRAPQAQPATADSSHTTDVLAMN